MESTHIGYSVPSGTGLVLAFDTGTHFQSLRDLRFVFGGPPSLRIRRVRGAFVSAPDIIFDGATPHEVTVFFARNSIACADALLTVLVDNLSSTDEPLQLSAIYDRMPIGVGCCC